LDQTAAAAASTIDAFSYLSVLLSIILGLAITQILKGIRGWALSRARVVVYWPTLILAALLLFVSVQSWWAMFGMRGIPVWTFGMFAVVLLQITILYMLAALVLPDFFGEQTIDLRQHYFAQRKLFFGLFVLVLLVSIAKDLVLGGTWPAPMNLAFHVVFIVLMLSAALSEREWYHKALAALGPLVFIVYVALLFERLR